MANNGNFLSSSKNVFKSVPDFEEEVKMKLKWSKSQWEKSGESGSRMNKLANSMNYWVGKLKPALDETSFIITIFNEERDNRTDIGSIISAVETLNSSIKVSGITEFRNPRYLCLHFKSKADKEFIEEKFKMLENSFVIYLAWALHCKDSANVLKVHWIPITVSLDLIKKELYKYVSFIEHERNSMKLMSGREMPLGKVTFKVKLNEGVSLENVPHTISVAKMEGLVTMPGRLPMCLNCTVLGHISKNCKLRFCYKCNKLMDKVHVCQDIIESRSYASVVKPNNRSVGIDPGDWGAAFDNGDIEPVDSVVDSSADKLSAAEIEIELLKSAVELAAVSKIYTDEQKAKSDGLCGQSGPSVELTVENACKGENLADGNNLEVYMLSDSNSVLSEDANDEGTFSLEEKKEKNRVKSDKTQKSGANINKSKHKKMSKTRNIVKASGGDNKNKNVKSDTVLRSYGLPIIHNARRIKEDVAFEKAAQKSPDYREFIFQDNPNLS